MEWRGTSGYSVTVMSISTVTGICIKKQNICTTSTEQSICGDSLGRLE